jgi:hypothetical protein
MPRGRPRKKKSYDGKKQSDKVDTNNQIPRQKRKYTRRKKDGNGAIEIEAINMEPKKRGRKRGRKRNDQELLLKPDEMIDYMIRNFPQMGIDRIREKVLNGLKIMRELNDNPYLLHKFKYDDNTYLYYDDQNTILNSDGQIVGFKETGTNKMFMINSNKDTRTYEQVIKQIEGK